MRTAQAYIKEGRLKVLVPFGLAADEEAVLVDGLVARVSRKAASTEVDLVRRVRGTRSEVWIVGADEHRMVGSTDDEMGLLHAGRRTDPYIQSTGVDAGVGPRLGAHP